MTEQNGNGYVVRMPQPHQLSKATRWLGATAFNSATDMDVAVKEALDAGKIEVDWSYVQFDADAVPVATRVAQVISYGQFQSDPDRTTQRDRFDSPTWRPCRRGRRPTVFPDAATAEATVQEHLATAEHFNIPPGNLKLAQVVSVEDYEASLNADPSDGITQRVTQVELAVARRRTEEAAAEEAALEARLRPPSSTDWHRHSEPQIQQRTRSNGSTVFRARASGRGASPTYATLAEAIQWRDSQL